MSKKKKLIKIIDIIVIILLFIQFQSMICFIIHSLQKGALQNISVGEVFFDYHFYGLEYKIYEILGYLSELNIIFYKIIEVLVPSFYPIIIFSNICVTLVKLKDILKQDIIKGKYRFLIIFNIIYLITTYISFSTAFFYLLSIQ